MFEILLTRSECESKCNVDIGIRRTPKQLIIDAFERFVYNIGAGLRWRAHWRDTCYMGLEQHYSHSELIVTSCVQLVSPRSRKTITSLLTRPTADATSVPHHPCCISGLDLTYLFRRPPILLWRTHSWMTALAASVNFFVLARALVPYRLHYSIITRDPGTSRVVYTTYSFIHSFRDLNIVLGLGNAHH